MNTSFYTYTYKIPSGKMLRNNHRFHTATEALQAAHRQASNCPEHYAFTVIKVTETIEALRPSTLAKHTKPERVELHPATDLWMRGARYGTVTKRFRTKVRVRLDATGKEVVLHRDNVRPIE